MKTAMLFSLFAVSAFAAGRFQRASVRVEKFVDKKPAYVGTTCTYEPKDAGVAAHEACRDSALNTKQSAAFEAFLETLK